MNAHEFVAKKGIDEAKRVLSGVPICSSAFNIINEIVIYYQMCDNWWWYNSAKKEYEMDYGKSMKIDLSELKQVVESVEIVESLGGIEQAKLYISLNNNLHSVMLKNGMTSSTKIEKAIADYELVESYKQVKCEVLDMVDVSPRCEVINETH